MTKIFANIHFHMYISKDVKCLEIVANLDIDRCAAVTRSGFYN